MAKRKIPKKLQGIVWSVPVEKLDINEHKDYIIHQILMFGNFDAIRWLLQTYPRRDIRRVFIKQPSKVYTKEAYNFVKNYVLTITSEDLSQSDYVDTFYQRA